MLLVRGLSKLDDCLTVTRVLLSRVPNEPFPFLIELTLLVTVLFLRLPNEPLSLLFPLLRLPNELLFPLLLLPNERLLRLPKLLLLFCEAAPAGRLPKL